MLPSVETERLLMLEVYREATNETVISITDRRIRSSIRALSRKSEMGLFSECVPTCAQKQVDTAGCARLLDGNDAGPCSRRYCT